MRTLFSESGRLPSKRLHGAAASASLRGGNGGRRQAAGVAATALALIGRATLATIAGSALGGIVLALGGGLALASLTSICISLTYALATS